MLLLNAAVFDTRYVGSLLAKSAIRSKGSIALPPELSLEVFEFMKSGIKGSEYHLVRVLSATSRGESTALRCEVELSVRHFSEFSLPKSFPHLSTDGTDDSEMS